MRVVLYLFRDSSQPSSLVSTMPLSSSPSYLAIRIAAVVPLKNDVFEKIKTHIQRHKYLALAPSHIQELMDHCGATESEYRGSILSALFTRFTSDEHANAMKLFGYAREAMITRNIRMGQSFVTDHIRIDTYKYRELWGDVYSGDDEVVHAGGLSLLLDWPIIPFPGDPLPPGKPTFPRDLNDEKVYEFAHKRLTKAHFWAVVLLSAQDEYLGHVYAWISTACLKAICMERIRKSTLAMAHEKKYERIGPQLVAAVASLARKHNLERIIVSPIGPMAQILTRLGFKQDRLNGTTIYLGEIRTISPIREITNWSFPFPWEGHSEAELSGMFELAPYTKEQRTFLERVLVQVVQMNPYYYFSAVTATPSNLLGRITAWVWPGQKQKHRIPYLPWRRMYNLTDHEKEFLKTLHEE